MTTTIKRGDSFRPVMTLSVPITGWLIASSIRDSQDTIVAELEETARTNTPTGAYTLKPKAAFPETDWPVGLLFWDIRYTDAAGVKVSTTTVELDCVKGITNG